MGHRADLESAPAPPPPPPRPTRLPPLFAAVLKKDGHEVALEKIEDWDVVELLVNGDVVFHCNIKDLEFGGDGKLDPLCEEARVAVLNAY